MAICSGCDGKFGSNGEPEIEVDSQDISDDGSVNIEATLSVPCGNCGSEFKTGSVSIETQFDVDSHDEDCTVIDKDNGDIEVTLESDSDRFRELVDKDRTFELNDINLEVGDDYRPKTTQRTLKDGTIKTRNVPFRYQRHYYDITGTATVRCSSCGGDTEITLEESISASELEEVG